MENTATASAAERLDAADRLLRTASCALAADAATLEVSVQVEEDGCRLRLLDTHTGWQVGLFFRQVEPQQVRDRVSEAARLRSWTTAPPVVEVTARPAELPLSA